MRAILFTILLLISVVALTEAQTSGISGKAFDAETKEPLSGVTIMETGTSNKTITAENGTFKLKTQSSRPLLLATFVGYESQTIQAVDAQPLNIALLSKSEGLETVVITANREASLRTEAPVAISKITSAQISDTKPSLLVELVNKVPGVVMLNYNNEQHGMGIRQPFGTSPYFLYLEDGIPLRPLGVFNHNALIETNIFALSNVEVIKGPASSLYGAEAVGGTINFITQKPTAVPTARVGLQADNYGYK